MFSLCSFRGRREKGRYVQGIQPGLTLSEMNKEISYFSRVDMTGFFWCCVVTTAELE